MKLIYIKILMSVVISTVVGVGIGYYTNTAVVEHSSETGLKLCTKICGLPDQGYAQALHYSAVGCLCDTEEGLKARQGYYEYINGKCERKPEN